MILKTKTFEKINNTLISMKKGGGGGKIPSSC